MTRILITGSRHWTNAAMIHTALADAAATHPGPATIVHGGAPGADQLAAALATTLGPHVTCERWLAHWEGPCFATCRPGHRRTRRDGATYCPAAGNYRNAAMVAAGAALCLGFPFGDRDTDSPGTRDCMRRAAADRIPVIDVPAATCAPLFADRTAAERRAWAIADRAGTKPLDPEWCAGCCGWHLAGATDTTTTTTEGARRG